MLPPIVVVKKNDDDRKIYVYSCLSMYILDNLSLNIEHAFERFAMVFGQFYEAYVLFGKEMRFDYKCNSFGYEMRGQSRVLHVSAFRRAAPKILHYMKNLKD